MKIDIYRSTNSSTKYLSVPAGTDVERFRFPSDLDKDYATLSPFKTQHEIIPGHPYIALDASDVVSQIEAKGFATHSTKITIKTTIGARPNEHR